MRAPAILLTVCFSIMWLLMGVRSIDIGRKHDFLNIYTGASLALEGRFALLHDHDTQLARERQLVPETQQLIPFVRPAFYALMIAPLALLPYHTAFWVWMALQVSLAAICIWWGCRRFGPRFLAVAYAWMGRRSG